MSRIRRLDASVVNKIAAGEVIERPAGVVKELMENSLDALATRIDVAVVSGGTELIRVVDNGEGIHPDDFVLAVTGHATSKIDLEDDLFRVRTMGFRGEALASIAAVSRLTLRSRSREMSSGLEFEVDAGQPGSLRPCGIPQGTQVEVRQLFASTPVRRKFLKTTATEFGHISEQFARIAVSHPRLHAVLTHNGKTVFELPATERLIDRLRLFYGSELADDLIEIDSEVGDVRLWGYVAHPRRSKSTRKGQSLFLNGRWIQDRSLQHALGEAYRGLLMVGRFPIAVLFLDMPPDLVDVNVHPTKAEVRFLDGRSLYRQLLAALRTKFLSMNLESSMRLPGNRGDREQDAPVDPAQRQQTRIEFSRWAVDQLAQQAAGRPVDSSPIEEPTSFGAVPSAGSNATAADAGSDLPERWPSPSGRVVAGGSEESSDGTGRLPAEAAVSRTDPAAQSIQPPHGGLGRVMQILDCYLVLETDDGLTVIDQHALHERVMYEQLRQRILSRPVESQRLLVPEPIELSPAEVAVLVDHRQALGQLGIELEEFGSGTVLLTSFPVMLARADRGQLVRDIAEQLTATGQQPSRRDILDRLMHMMSCRAAVKAGQRLTQEEMESLLEQRHLIDDAHHCPHGRPTALVLSRDELDRQFGRLG